MQFVPAADSEAAALHNELVGRAADTDAAGLMTANLWLWVVEQPDPNPRAVVSALFGGLAMPRRELLEPHTAARPWVPLPPDAVGTAAMGLLTSGTSLEIPAFDDDVRAAERFVGRVLAWVGSPVAGFASMEHRPDGSAAGFGVYQVPDWVDEGLVLVGPQRVGVLWFVGTD
jgi:hypothetical protein